jgi:capsular polysaccharide biosynthesis protein
MDHPELNKLETKVAEIKADITPHLAITAVIAFAVGLLLGVWLGAHHHI